MALSGLVTLTSDLSTSKWGHGSHVSWVSFLPDDTISACNAFDSQLSVRCGTDRPRDNVHRCIMPLPYGGRI